METEDRYTPATWVLCVIKEQQHPYPSFQAVRTETSTDQYIQTCPGRYNAFEITEFELKCEIQYDLKRIVHRATVTFRWGHHQNLGPP